jgi:hypothetical protein
MTRTMTPTIFTLALLAAACSAPAAVDVEARTDPPTSPATTQETVVTDGPHEVCLPLEEITTGVADRPPATQAPFPWDRADPAVLEGFDFDRVLSGGPPPDGIMPIDEPCFDSVAAANDWLQPQSPVMVVEVEGDRRAYPLAIMTQHEIVNDVIGGVPVVVTYCPLCNSGLAFERTVDGAVLDFGTSGRLYQSNLVMYDRQTRSLWSQFDGVAIAGADHVGAQLERLSTSLVGWAQFAEASPEGLVLSRDSVPGRDYGRNPYPGYEGSGDGFLFEGPRDDRLPPNTRVVGLGTDTDPVAVPLPELRERRVVAVDIEGDPVTVWWAPGQASALDAATVDAGDDVGSTAAFRATLDDGTVLSFAPGAEEDRFIDDATGSTWNLLGEAIDGPLAGTRLTAVPLDDTFWFVWFAFQPDTTVHVG